MVREIRRADRLLLEAAASGAHLHFFSCRNNQNEFLEVRDLQLRRCLYLVHSIDRRGLPLGTEVGAISRARQVRRLPDRPDHRRLRRLVRLASTARNPRRKRDASRAGWDLAWRSIIVATLLGAEALG